MQHTGMPPVGSTAWYKHAAKKLSYTLNEAAKIQFEVAKCYPNSLTYQYLYHKRQFIAYGTLSIAILFPFVLNEVNKRLFL